MPFFQWGKGLASTGKAILSMPFRLIIPMEVYAAMVAQATTEQPNECVGLLAGVVEECSDVGASKLRVGRVLKRYALVNEANSPIEFFNAGKDLFAAERDMRIRCLDTLAVYHSHPATEPRPSKKDLARHYWGPEVMSLILSLATTPPIARAWWLTEADYREAQLEVR
jgi:[CysO sulfur-carrier protein]-S-L-cysteine hydrolase